MGIILIGTGIFFILTFCCGIGAILYTQINYEEISK